MASTIHSITFDCADPVRLAAFWQAALGYEVEAGSVPDEQGASLVDPAGHGPRMLFNPVPEGKIVKNRVHVDLAPNNSMDAEVARLIGLGARKIRVFQKPYGTWTVMQDPEGNEFCVERGPLDKTNRT